MFTRSSKLSISLANTGKKLEISSFIHEYTRIVNAVVDLFWDEPVLRQLLDKSETDKIKLLTPTPLSARALQCAGKQALGILRGVREKRDGMQYWLKKLLKDQPTNIEVDHTEKISFLRSKLASLKISKPVLNRVEPQLDSRFVTISLEKRNSFDCWITLGSFGTCKPFAIPVKRNKHLNRLLRNGKLCGGLRLSENAVTFAIETQEPALVEGKTVGVDVGVNNAYTVSDGFVSLKDPHGHDLNSIIDRLKRREKGSCGFRRAQQHRTNYIGWAANQIDLNGIGKVQLEKLRDMRRGKNVGKTLSHWTYRMLLEKLEARCVEHGVRVAYLNPAYTSQRCSRCGWVQKANRKQDEFLCCRCGFAAQADENASRNLAFDLPPLPAGGKRKGSNLKGFEWNCGQERYVVPDNPKTEQISICFVTI